MNSISPATRAKSKFPAINSIFGLASKGSGYLLDQLVYSLVNFTWSVLLARWVSPIEYGNISLTYTGIVLANTLYLALIGEPSVVLWAQNIARRGRFINEVYYLNNIFTILTIVVTVIAFLLSVKHTTVSFYDLGIIVFICVALPLSWMLRQFCHADLHPWRALMQSTIYGSITIGGLFFLKGNDLISTLNAFALLGLGAAASCLCTLYAYTPVIKFKLATGKSASLAEFIKYGRWSFPASIAIWVANNVFLVGYAAVGRVEDTARLKAFLNILLPYQQFLLGSNLLLLPTLSRIYAKQQNDRFKKLSLYALLIVGCGGVVFSFLLCLNGQYIYKIFYGNNYLSDAKLIIYGTGLPIAWALIAVGRTICRAGRNPKFIFTSYIYSILLVGFVAFPLGILGDISNSLLAMTAIQLAVAISIIQKIPALTFDNEIQLRKK